MLPAMKITDPYSPALERKASVTTRRKSREECWQDDPSESLRSRCAERQRRFFGLGGYLCQYWFDRPHLQMQA
jgi:hypothetical protein